jgi:hypothetical protein
MSCDQVPIVICYRFPTVGYWELFFFQSWLLLLHFLLPIRIAPFAAFYYYLSIHPISHASSPTPLTYLTHLHT